MSDRAIYKSPEEMARAVLDEGSRERVNKALEQLNQMTHDLSLTAADQINIAAHMLAQMALTASNPAGYFQAVGLVLQAKIAAMSAMAASLHTSSPPTGKPN